MCLLELVVHWNLYPNASTEQTVDLPHVTSCGPGPVSEPGAFMSCGYFPGKLVGSYFLVFIGAVFPVFVATYSAVRNIERTQINAALCLGATPAMLIRDFLVPGALPVIFPGLRIALSVGWMCVVAAELIAAQSGLGCMIQQSRVLLQTQNVVTGMIAIGVIGFAMNGIMTIIERRLIPWQESSKGR